MPVYIYEGKTRQGNIVSGEMDAPNETVVTVMLRRQQIQPLKISPKPREFRLAIPFFKKKVKEKEIAVFTRQFGTMINAGLPLVQCLDILANQQPNRTFKDAILQIKKDVEGGSTLADALKKHPSIFDTLYVNLIAAGEVGGILDTILNRLALYIEKSVKLKRKVKGAMFYPISILVVAVLVTMVILVYVIPTFQKMFADFGSALPAPTQFVINLSNFVRKNIYIIVFSVAIALFALRRFYKTERGKALIDRLLIKTPVIGPIIIKVAVARFTRTLGTMVASGVPILDALEIVSKSAGNVVIENAIIKTRQSISEGKTIADPLMETKVFPPMVVQMIGVGEATGALDSMLSKIADFYEEEVDAAVDALTSLLEPALMIFLGVTIGGLIISMYLPIFSLAGAVGG